MKKLFLSSSFVDVAGLLPLFEKELTGKTVSFIPTASTVEKVTFYVQAGKEALESLGMIVDVLDISSESPDEIRRRIAANDCMYVSGGNTFFLLQELKRTGADAVIVRAVKGGKLYIGESAGSIVASKNIEYIKAMDSSKKAPELTNFDALGLTDFYTVPHVRNFPFKKAAKKIIDEYSASLNLLAIANDEAILVEDDAVRIEYRART
ncbi:Type 1 glutamine amidotransferase-like domain-containing protein [Treponema socranskii]|uniref:peptidase E n=1 Tax=Treponema socranskii TaxID=53419 RepID=UPI003D8B8708